MIIFSVIFITGRISKGVSLPNLVCNFSSSPLPSPTTHHLTVPRNLGPSRSHNPSSHKLLDMRYSPSPQSTSPVVNRRRSRTLSESNDRFLLRPPPVNTEKASSCPTSPRLPLHMNGGEVTKSRPATPYILSSSPQSKSPANSDKLPRITHSPRLLRPLSPIYKPLETTRGLLCDSPVIRVRASDSDSEDSGDCARDRISIFLESLTPAEEQDFLAAGKRGYNAGNWEDFTLCVGRHRSTSSQGTSGITGITGPKCNYQLTQFGCSDIQRQLSARLRALGLRLHKVCYMLREKSIRVG